MTPSARPIGVLTVKTRVARNQNRRALEMRRKDGYSPRPDNQTRWPAPGRLERQFGRCCRADNENVAGRSYEGFLLRE
jgi:hypothetical protein